MDYKFLADLEKLSPLTWITDSFYGYEKDYIDFQIEMYKHLSKIKKLTTNSPGEFFYGTKRIAYIRYEDEAWKRGIPYIKNIEYRNIIASRYKIYPVFVIVSKNKRDFTSTFELLPPSLQNYMISKKCVECNAYASKNKEGYCPNQVVWTFNQKEYKGCKFYCLHFEYPKASDAAYYAEIVKKEYNLG